MRTAGPPAEIAMGTFSRNRAQGIKHFVPLGLNSIFSFDLILLFLLFVTDVLPFSVSLPFYFSERFG